MASGDVAVALVIVFLLVAFLAFLVPCLRRRRERLGMHELDREERTFKGVLDHADDTQLGGVVVDETPSPEAATAELDQFERLKMYQHGLETSMPSFMDGIDDDDEDATDDVDAQAYRMDDAGGAAGRMPSMGRLTDSSESTSSLEFDPNDVQLHV